VDSAVLKGGADVSDDDDEGWQAVVLEDESPDVEEWILSWIEILPVYGVKVRTDSTDANLDFDIWVDFSAYLYDN